MSRQLDRRDAFAILGLLLVTIVFYAPIAIQGRVLAGFDTQVYFYPNASYLAERLRLGEVPLWNPYIFGGVPFLANSQVGALYPPTWLFAIGPVTRMYSVLVVGHVWLLALGTYLLGRSSLSLGRAGAIYASVALAFGGFAGGMSGHLNQIEAFAWLPFCILALERTAAKRVWRLAVLSAVPFALSALAGHSQVLYLTAILAVMASFARTLARWVGRYADRQLTIRDVASDIGRMVVGPLLAIFIAAAQLVPTIELTSLSIRAHGLSFADAAAFSLPPTRLFTALAPSIGQLPPSSEWFGWVGLSAMALALYALWRQLSIDRVLLAIVALGGLILALGQFTPIYALAFGVIPGVRLYRVPARYLTYWTVAIALLAGIGLDDILHGDVFKKSGVERARRTRWLAWWLLAGGALVALGLGAYKFRRLIDWPSRPTLGLWIVTAGLMFATVVIVKTRRSVAAPAFLVILTGELFVGSLDLPLTTASVWPSAVENTRMTINHLRTQDGSARVLGLGDNSYDPGDLADVRARLGSTLPPQARDQYITSMKLVDGLSPNLPLQFHLRTIDGYDGGILPLDRYDDLKRLFPLQGRDVADGRLRLQLLTAPDPGLLGWLNIRFLVMNRIHDRWINGVYYDLAISQPLAPGESILLRVNPMFPATSVGIITAPPPNGGSAGRLDVSVSHGTSASVDVDGSIPPASEFAYEYDSAPLRLWRVSLAAPASATDVRLTWQGNQPITLRSVSLIDDRIAASQSIPASPGYLLSYLGDMKIYDNQEVQSRAFLADGLEIKPDLEAVIAELRGGSWNPRSVAVASALDGRAELPFSPTDGAGATTILVDDPERMVVETQATRRKILVVTDSAYPGWQVTVDGVVAPIQTVDVLFRGVAVPGGRHVVTFSYSPASWRVGLALSVLGLGGLIVGIILTRQR